MSSQEEDLYGASDGEDQVRPLIISRRQGYVQPRDESSTGSRRQSSMASTNSDDEAPVRPLSISERDKKVRPQSASPGGLSRPSSVNYEEEPDDTPTPRAGSPAPSVPSRVRKGTEPFAKRSVSDIRKDFEGVSNDNGPGFAARGFKIPRGQPSAAPRVGEDSVKSVANIRQLSQTSAHSKAQPKDECPDEGSRTPRQPHFQGLLCDVPDMLDHGQTPSRRSSVASSRRWSRTPSIPVEAKAPGKRRDPASPRQSRPLIIHQETYDALHGRGPATVSPQALSRPPPGDTTRPCRESIASSHWASRAPSVDNIDEEIDSHHARRVAREGKQPAEEQGSDRGSAVSSRRTSRVLDNIEEEIEAECTRRKQKEAEEKQARRESVSSPRHASRALTVDNLVREIEAEHALRKAAEEESRSSIVDSSRRSRQVLVDNIEEQIEAEYARRAHKEAEEQQSLRSSAASSRRSSRAPAMSIEEEVEALYTRRNATYRKQVFEADDDRTVTLRALSPSRRPSSRVPAASSPRSPTLPRYEYEENQFPAYTPSRRSSVHPRHDSCSSDSTCRSSLDESNIHPAFRAEPYFSPSSPRREPRAESLDHRRSKTGSSSSTNERKCSTLESLCRECHHALEAIQPDVGDKYLECPPNIHPILIECILTGTSDDAAAIVVDLHQRIIRYISRRFDLHAAVRRSATSGRRSGHWYDITTKELPSSRACSTSRNYDNKSPGTIQKVFYSPYSWAKKQEKKKQKHIKKTHMKLRDMKILMDFPWQIEKGGMVERKIFESLPRNVKVTKLKHIRAHHTLHRLEWWARTHPVHHYTADSSWERGESSRSRERGPGGQYSH
ncbi:hypothetical protein BDV10DRAFT_183077 [Aspergillus recurvatus]